jgi:hypothetical protein
MKTEIVVARYNENLDWLKKIKKSKDIKITVYNKGLPDIDIPFIQLPNSGRESGTYLYHIINNYDKLADQTIFCQGDPIFHAPDLIELINKYRTKFEPVQPLSLSYWREDEPPHYEPNPPNPTIKATKNLWFSNKGRVHVEYMNNDFVTLYPYHYTDIQINRLVDKFKNVYNIQNALKFNIERFRLKDVNLDYLIPFCYAAIFSVNKEAILNNSVDFYNNIYSILMYDVRPGFLGKPMDQGLFLERLWMVIFNYKKYNKNYLSIKPNEYEVSTKNIVVKNNVINFNYFNIYCQLYINITIDNIQYAIYISKLDIFFKKKESNISTILYNLESKRDKTIKKILKDETDYNVLITLKNNNLKLTINNNIIINYDFNKIKVNHKTIKSAIVYDMAKYNKFSNIL